MTRLEELKACKDLLSQQMTGLNCKHPLHWEKMRKWFEGVSKEIDTIENPQPIVEDKTFIQKIMEVING
jgi:hypothetical protein